MSLLVQSYNACSTTDLHRGKGMLGTKSQMSSRLPGLVNKEVKSGREVMMESKGGAAPECTMDTP